MRTDARIKGRYRNSRGFTLFEIIAVLVILSILSAAILYMGARNMGAELHAATEVLKSHLRYAQTQAMNRNNIAAQNLWGISCNGNQYSLFEGDAAQVRVLPDREAGADLMVSLTDKGVTATVFAVSFDDRGMPYSGIPPVRLAAPLTITMRNPETGATRNITVTPLTGFIQ